MRMSAVRVASLLVFLAVGVAAAAQYGHPLKGSWSGDWGQTKETRNRLLLELNWDGQAVTGTINPGPNAVPLQKASLDPSNWTVRLEAETKDRSGQMTRYLVEGKIENLGAYNRVMTGTWSQGSVKGDFRLVRN
ncbi:MAG: hypothetical protein EXQ53_04225 [Acidobacteria bacterium]|nr:hypothetical protein [Acidobacteriota bacterium]